MDPIRDKNTILAAMLNSGMKAEEAVGLVHGGHDTRWFEHFIHLVYRLGRKRRRRRAHHEGHPGGADLA